jgi:hypothetical protein
MPFLYRLETRDGVPAEPSTLTTAVPNWRAGDTIPLGHRTLRVVDVKDEDADHPPVLGSTWRMDFLALFPSVALDLGRGRRGYCGPLRLDPGQNRSTQRQGGGTSVRSRNDLRHCGCGCSRGRSGRRHRRRGCGCGAAQP